MGVLMKLIPQINVFAVQFQLNIILGMTLLFAFAVPTTEFIEKYINQVFVASQELLKLL